MAKVVQRGLFSTHRGTIVKRAAFVAVIMVVGLTVASNLAKGPSSSKVSAGPAVVAQAAPTDVAPDGSASDPVVASYVANPFSAQARSYYEIGSGSTLSETDSGNAAPGASGSTDPVSVDGEPTAAPTVANEANAIKQTAQRFAPDWATYSNSETAAEFVKTLPGLAPGADATITKAIQGTWSSRFTKTSAFLGTLSGSAPIVDSYDATKGTARVSVVVDQEAVGSEDAQQIKPITYQVDLVRYLDSDATPFWGVVSAMSA